MEPLNVVPLGLAVVVLALTLWAVVRHALRTSAEAMVNALDALAKSEDMLIAFHRESLEYYHFRREQARAEADAEALRRAAPRQQPATAPTSPHEPPLTFDVPGQTPP